ncbi:uncharacterized protein N0V89_000022 [Didymosphaeria variabile]|uniref:Uncharacterized protein n=1 Tax=Didymosphaeria variabile TaxID=1932322 RepID=A0A9W8XUC8_9PLEO|nr:uncharacterized protein N0V89_000022 [Didymosphaeria variabile]KAJ4359468.1 hypothetical protein N0V89_000022 [Didymosphaeria variabile]
MSQLNAQFVKQGFWVDNSRGPVMGQTITTTTKTGNLVVALMAVLTTLGTSQLWSLVIFGYHQMRVNARPKDGLLMQQQALMRTLPAPFTMLADWLKLWWVWRKRVDRALSRSLLLIMLAILFAAVTIVVGIFSSYLVDSTNITVLVQSPYCGPVDFLGDDIEGSTENYSLWNGEYMQKVADLADSYARDCYVSRTTVPERCRIFIRPTLPFQQQRVACPFESSMCKNISQPGLAIDTGLLDLNEYFGLNLAASDTVMFRRKTTCGVLELNGHYDVLNASNFPDFELNTGRAPWAGEQMMRMYFGHTMASNFTFAVQYMPEERESLATTK